MRLISFLAVAFLAFILGAWLAWRNSFPFEPLLRDGFLAADALYEVYLTRPGLRDTDVWALAESGDDVGGVLEIDRAQVAPGLTLIAIGQSAHLIDLDGTVRHSWHMPFARLLGDEAQLASEPHESRLYWRPVRLLPGGDLLTIVHLMERTPDGLALLRLDRSSAVRWVHHGNLHHDLDVGQDGRIYALAQAVRDDPPEELTALRGPMLDERLQIFSDEGKLLQDISLTDAFANSPYAALLERVAGPKRYEKGDYLHVNNVDLVTPAIAARFPFANAGDLLLSFREISTLALLDPTRMAIVWARRGPWFHQHDPDFLANGNLLLFDNQGDWARGGRSRVIEYDPETQAIVWAYPDRPEGELWSDIRGDQQMLSNGNVLINEFKQGRLHEVTPAGNLVWLYRCPFHHPEDRNFACNILWAERYAGEILNFPFNGGRSVYPIGK